MSKNKYFQYTKEKKYWMKNVLLLLYVSFYIFITILCTKMSSVYKPLVVCGDKTCTIKSELTTTCLQRF